MTDMGDKIHSKRIAKKAGVSMMPGYDGEIPVSIVKKTSSYVFFMRTSKNG